MGRHFSYTMAAAPTWAEQEMRAAEHARLNETLGGGGERPLLYFAEAANQELADLRTQLKTQSDQEHSQAYALRIDLATAQQNETRLTEEINVLRHRLDETQSEVCHVSDAMTSVSIKAQASEEELKLARAALEMEKEKQAREFDSLRSSTADAVHEAAAARKMKEDQDRKLDSLMTGNTAKEAELEGALFNSVHECAQLRKDHQDAIDEMAITMSRQKADYDRSMSSAQASFDNELSERKVDLSYKSAQCDELEKRVSSVAHLHTTDMASASETQHKLAMSLTETREGLGQLSSTHQSTTIALQNLQLDARMQQREAEIERKNLESVLSQEQTRLAHQVNMADTKNKLTREQYERQLVLKGQEHQTELEMVAQQNDVRFEKSDQVAAAAAASIQAAADKKRNELEMMLLESNETRKVQVSEIDRLKVLLTDQLEHSKKRESVYEAQLTSHIKKCDRLELERSTAVKQATKVTEESEMMRRTLESALREADTTAKNLREDLERVNRKFTAELNQSRQEVFRLKEQLSSTKSELEQSEEAREAANKQHWEEMTAQKKVTERVQLELASSRKSEERLNLEKQELLEKIRQLTVERQRLSTDLDSERKSHAETKVELGEALANAQAIHREKLESVSSMRSQLVQERATTDSVSHQKELLGVDLRRAAEDRDSARKELAYSMRRNMALNKESEEANKLSEGLKYRMEEVSSAQEDVLGGPTFHPRFMSSGASASLLSPRLHSPKPSNRYIS